jgi:Cellulase (glycosyl hydrolase family 5)
VTALAVVVEVGNLWSPAGPARAARETGLVFPETGFSLAAPFLGYWQGHGGLFSYGYPITGQVVEDGLLVQYFERARFEYHPENAGTRYEVLLTALGSQLTAGRDFAPPPILNGHSPPGAYTFYAVTRHTLRGAFQDYWAGQGGLERFGYPISEEVQEASPADGHIYTAQYFERARLEYHPENPEAYRVLQGLLGRQLLALRRKAARHVQALNGQLVAGPDLRGLRLKGFNYFPRDFAWTEFDQWPLDRVAFELDQARKLGANALRVFIREDAFGGEQAGWSHQEGFRKFVDLARARGFYLVVSLFDGLRKAPEPSRDNWPAGGTPEEARDKAFLTAVVWPWRDEPSILAWDLYNEPDFVSEVEYQWDAHRANRLDWLARIAAETRRLDHNHLLTIGVALAGSNTQPATGGGAHHAPLIPEAQGKNQETVAGLVDFVSVHYYLRNYRDQGPEAVIREMKAQTHKPVLVEEAGQPTFPGFGDDGDQARFVGDVMRAVVATNAAGMLAWTLYEWPRHAGNSEGHYGFYQPDDTPKPATQAFLLGY